jgi:hypothetical protein
MAAQKRIDQAVDVCHRNALFRRVLANCGLAIDDAIAVEKELAGRRKQNGRGFRLRALTGGIETSYRIDLIAPEFDPYGIRQLGWIDVDDVAANRDFTGFFDERHSLVAAADQARGEQISIERRANRDALGRFAKEISCGNAKGEGGHRGNHDRARLLAAIERLIQEMKNFHALADEEGLRREAVEGQGVVARKRPNPRRVFAFAEHASEREGSVVGGARMGRDVENGAVAVSADQMTGGNSVRGTAQAC